MRPPFDFIPPHLRKPLFLAALIWTLFLFAVLQVLNRSLLTLAAPAGIVSFELAGTPERARDIIASWAIIGPLGPTSLALTFAPLLDAAFGLGLDYLFMPSYAVAIALGVLLASGRHHGLFASVGTWVGWGSLAAALFDATENLALWHILRDMSSVAPWPQLAFVCASFKFALIITGILYALLAAVLPAASPRASANA